LRRVALILLLASLPSLARASTLTLTLPDFDGPEHNFGFPIDLGVIGTFSYSLPAGATLTAASIGGYYGTVTLPYSTAGFDLVIDGQTYTGCDPTTSCSHAGSGQRWFDDPIPSSEFAFLAGGSVGLDVVQTTGSYVRYGTPTLTLDYSYSVPEPSELLLLSISLGVVCVLAWHFNH